MSPTPGKIEENDHLFMSMALEVASAANGMTRPNPMVGCLIVDRDGVEISRGYHERAGLPHAERMAISNCGDLGKLKGSVVYVTLEPCSHFGRTPPCTEALIDAKVSEVVIALRDPNPHASGGAEILKKAGINVRFLDEFSFLAKDLSRVFLTNIQDRRSRVALKLASSIDGKLNLSNGESQWITGQESREFVHSLRSYHEATCISAATLIRDNSSLTIRNSVQSELVQKILILDRSGLLNNFDLKKLKLFSLHAPENIFIATTSSNCAEVASKSSQFYQTVVYENSDTLKSLSTRIYKDLRWASILVEAGPRLASQMVRDRDWDDLHLFQAPFLIGEASGNGFNQLLKLDDLNAKIMLERKELKILGNDVYQRFSN